MNNPLKYVRILESTGVTREQAEAHVQLIAEITEGELATNQDITNLKQDLATVKAELRQDIRNLEIKMDTSVERLEHKMLQLEYRMTIKLGTIVTVVVAAATTITKLL